MFVKIITSLLTLSLVACIAQSFKDRTDSANLEPVSRSIVAICLLVKSDRQQQSKLKSDRKQLPPPTKEDNQE